MSLSWTLIVIGIFTSLVGAHEITESIAHLVVDTIAAFLFPATTLSTIMCAKTENAVDLSKILSKNGIANNRVEFDRFSNEIDKSTWHKLTFFLDLNCSEASDVLKKANDSGLFSGPIKWLIFRDIGSEEYDLSEIFGDLGVFADSEILILQRISDDRASISSLYRPSMARGIKVESRGNWISGEGIRVYDRHVASLRRRDLQKIQLKTTIVVTNPDTLNHLTDYRDVHVDTITKSNYFWLNHLASAMNATLAYNVVNSWGYRDKSNGSWSGMMGHLSRKEIDIGGTCMFLTADRMDNVTYIPLATPTRLAFIFRQPPLSFVSNLFTLPFRRSVWIAIGILLSVIVLMLLLASRWEWLTKQTHASEPTLSDNLLLVIGAVAQQGFGFNPLTVPSRIVLLMLLLAVLNLYASYTANIVALLQSTTNSIQTLRDLLESPIKCGAQDIVYNRHYFKLERDPIRRRIIDQKIVPKSGKSNWMTAEEGIGEVRRGFFAFFMEIGPAYRIIQETFEEDEKCGFREMYFIEHFDPMFTVIKQSPYLEIIRVNALKIEESGLKSREMSKFYTKRPPCNGRSKFISVGLNECYFAFYTIACGLLLALGLLVLELLWMKWGSVQRKISE